MGWSDDVEVEGRDGSGPVVHSGVDGHRIHGGVTRTRWRHRRAGLDDVRVGNAHDPGRGLEEWRHDEEWSAGNPAGVFDFLNAVTRRRQDCRRSTTAWPTSKFFCTCKSTVSALRGARVTPGGTR